MKIIFSPFLFLALLLFSSCKNYPLNCDVIKTGRFFQYSTTHNKKVLIERNDTMQVERDLSSGELLINRIKWLSPCTYLLTPLPSQDSSLDNLSKFFQTISIKIEVEEVATSFYIYTTRIDSANKTLRVRDTVFFESKTSR